MVIGEGIEAGSLVPEIPGEADTLKVGVKSPFLHGIVYQGINNFRRYIFSRRQIDEMNLAAVHGIPEQ
jgi:hypothetical protein